MSDLVRRLREGYISTVPLDVVCKEAANRIEKLEELERENAALRADAERYRWLREHPVFLWREKLDAVVDEAIDAARKP